MNLEQTVQEWRDIRQLQESGNAGANKRAFFRGGPAGFVLCGMRVDAEAMDELSEIMEKRDQLQRDTP